MDEYRQAIYQDELRKLNELIARKHTFEAAREDLERLITDLDRQIEIVAFVATRMREGSDES